MRLFQIEEPEGGPSDPDAPGAAVGIDASGACAQVAMAVGGNAVLLADRAGYERILPVPALGAAAADWRGFFEGARLRAERALARPVTHAVVVLATAATASQAATVLAAGEQAGLAILHLTAGRGLDTVEAPALAAAILAEDLAPRPEAGPR